MPYLYYGYGAYDSSYRTNTGLPYNTNIESIAVSARNGTLSGFNSGYSWTGGCTWWASGRSAMTGGRNWAGGGNASQWFGTFGGTYGISASQATASSIEAGDVLCFGSGYGHVAFVEEVGGDTLYISEAASGTNNYNVLCMSRQSLSSLLSNKSHWFWGEPWQGVLKGSGSGPSPVPPQPDPGPGDNWHWEDTTWTETSIEIVRHYVPYTDIYECGNNSVFGDQSGTQDVPQAPYKISNSLSRINQRWEPFNMYTDERTLTYTTDGQPIWSNWETKHTGSESFDLGDQPAYGNGWEMEWRGDDD